MAFTQAQKNWFLKAAGYKCQASAPHHCNGDTHPLECDHIMPQAFLQSLGLTWMIDSPINCCVKCRNAHNIKHPDRLGYAQAYHQLMKEGKNAFQMMHQSHIEQASRHQVYWNNTYDHLDMATALKLMEKASEPYPWSKAQQKMRGGNNGQSSHR